MARSDLGLRSRRTRPASRGAPRVALNLLDRGLWWETRPHPPSGPGHVFALVMRNDPRSPVSRAHLDGCDVKRPPCRLITNQSTDRWQRRSRFLTFVKARKRPRRDTEP